MLILNLINTSIKSQPNTRQLWQWINIIFNKVDEERRTIFGPDRTCAEWILRNGGQVKWIGNADYLADYNQLPPEGTKLYIQEVDASGSSIMHYGFPHFEGCKHIEKIIFHDCGYLYNQALEMMKPIDKTLKNLEVSSCGNITEEGLLHLANLNNLKVLLIYDLPYVKDKGKILTALKEKLPNCQVEYK